MEEMVTTHMPSISEKSGNINYKTNGGYKLAISRACNFLLRIYRKLFFTTKQLPNIQRVPSHMCDIIVFSANGMKIGHTVIHATT